MNFDFSETIREFRKKEDFTQKKLGDMCGVSAATVCRAEKGVISKGTRKIVSKIASYHIRKQMLNIRNAVCMIITKFSDNRCYINTIIINSVKQCVDTDIKHICYCRKQITRR